MRIVRTAAAEEDLIGIWLYVAEQNPIAADALLDRFESRWCILMEFPLAGMAREDIGPNIRQLIENNYIVFYKTSEHEIEIVRVLHTRQKQNSGLLSDS